MPHFVQLIVLIYIKSYKHVHCLQLVRARWGKQWLHTYLTEEAYFTELEKNEVYKYTCTNQGS